MALIDGLVSYYKLDESSGNATDAHGSNTLTDNNTVGTASGKISTARDFERSNDEYLYNSSPSGVNLQTVSVSAWVNVESFVDYGGIVSNFPTGWYLHTMAGSTRFEWYIQDSVKVQSTGHSTATWYHLVGVMDGATDTLTLYVNGSSVGTNTFAGTMTYSTPHLQIGNTRFLGTFDGLIDEVGIWNVALTGADVTALYNSGSGLAYPFSAGTTPKGPLSNPFSGPFGGPIG